MAYCTVCTAHSKSKFLVTAGDVLGPERVAAPLSASLDAFVDALSSLFDTLDAPGAADCVSVADRGMWAVAPHVHVGR